MNKYRVDRVTHDAKIVPCGTNSIVYIGDSLDKAKTLYRTTSPGVDVWGKANRSYTVSLSYWDDRKGDYIFITKKTQ